MLKTSNTHNNMSSWTFWRIWQLSPSINDNVHWLLGEVVCGNAQITLFRVKLECLGQIYLFLRIHSTQNCQILFNNRNCFRHRFRPSRHISRFCRDEINRDFTLNK